MRYKNYVVTGVAALALSISHVSCAREAGASDFDVSAQELKYALRDLARQAGVELVAPSETLAGKKAQALRGHYSLRQAVDALLEGSDLTADLRDGTIFIRGRSDSPAAAVAAKLGSAEIVVTGTRLRGVELPSPRITTTQEDIRKAGITNLGDFARALPQSFSGGQNPGVTVGALGDNNENVSSASSLNLRGLGPDATLTLLNGRRLAYNSAAQAIDISAIPLLAVDRIEIVTDGASAVYGSDAVAGVANIILKRSYDGFLGSVRVGGSTDGGDTQQQYSLLGGVTGSSAGFLAVYDFEHDTAIRAGDRSFASDSFPSSTLLPSQRHHSGLITAYWEPAPDLTTSIDALYSSRRSLTIQPIASDNYTDLGYRREPKVHSYAVSPGLEWTMAGGWKLTAFATVAADKTIVNTRLFSGGALNFASLGSYANSSRIAEANLEGALVHFPAGDVRLAVGGGYRSAKLSANLRVQTASGSAPGSVFSERRNSSYAFGELNIPLISQDQHVPAVDQLSITGAARYERYSGNTSVATPKLGLIYVPVNGARFKLSWGRSFKTPTLFQQYSGYDAQLVPVSYFGASGYPADATALFLSGGNAALRPERASTWTGGLELKPAAIENFRAEITAFHVRYKNRISQPITSYEGLLGNPAYRDLVALSPGVDDVLASIGGSTSGLQNQTGSPFNPAGVAAIIDSRYVNISSQVIKGIDVLLDYRWRLGDLDSLALRANASYLDSSRTLTPTSSAIPSAGVIFNPPHWRGRAGLIWDREGLSLSAYGNYIGRVIDNRRESFTHVGALTTCDLTAVYRWVRSPGPLDGVEFTLTVQNLFNAKPDRVRTSAPFYPAFDSTNYSAIGRFISFSITKAL